MSEEIFSFMLHSVECYSISTSPLKRSFKNSHSMRSRKHTCYCRKDYYRRKKWQTCVSSPLPRRWTAVGDDKFLFFESFLSQVCGDLRSERQKLSLWWGSSCFFDLLHSHNLSQFKFQLLLISAGLEELHGLLWSVSCE